MAAVAVIPDGGVGLLKAAALMFFVITWGWMAMNYLEHKYPKYFGVEVGQKND